MSVFLQRLHWAGCKRPQRVVGQNDEHVHRLPIFCGPCDGKGAVCAAAGELEEKNSTETSVFRLTITPTGNSCGVKKKKSGWEIGKFSIQTGEWRSVTTSDLLRAAKRLGFR